MKKRKVAVIMGSNSDLPTMQHAIDLLKSFHISVEVNIVSAHRTPEFMFAFAKEAASKEFQIIIAGAGGAAHLPGMVASITTLPVIGVPIQSRALNGMDSLLSIVQMPGGIPVATMSIGESGAKNAALFAIQILALKDPELNSQLQQFREKQTNDVLTLNQTKG